ncbi:MAG: nucleotidyl transferase AbiEii/AbiGii toxin family protein [Candidatus Krumholzibacteria bacterium]|nr:nucleotidyl transferase AbiEii/AbiGii toxin family protein [Candidatus Krumholzibacteria bacterium]
MKAHLRHLVDGVEGGVNQKICIAREYLQARTLQSLQEDGVFTRWAFQGGTALRFLFALPRFSEDLDFALVRVGEDARFAHALKRVERAFRAEGYDVAVKSKPEKTVASAFIGFTGLLHELGLSPQRRQIFSVKVEVDTNPPAGAELDTTLVRRHVTLNLHHYDKASLLSGKLHALLSRPWCKGRDLYDLAWYLADPTWPEPNLTLLDCALAQSAWKGPQVAPENWKQIVRDKLESLDWNAARSDVLPFLERPREVDLIRREHFLRLLE